MKHALNLLLPLILTAALVAAGCSRAAEQEPEAPPPAEGAAAPGHPALNKLNETKKNMAEIDAKRREQNKAVEEGNPGGDGGQP